MDRVAKGSRCGMCCGERFEGVQTVERHHFNSLILHTRFSTNKNQSAKRVKGSELAHLLVNASLTTTLMNAYVRTPLNNNSSDLAVSPHRELSNDHHTSKVILSRRCGFFRSVKTRRNTVEDIRMGDSEAGDCSGRI